MSYQVLARKWRPSRFEEVVGQEHVLRALTNALDQQRLHHAYLFTGTRGVGKTTLARILARCLNCERGVSAQPCGVCGACTDIGAGRFVDLIEVDAASRTKVDDTRELLDNVQYAPTHARYKVYLIDEVHMLSTHSFNALLKTLEEPPPHVKFLLATTDPQKLPVTVLSRCLQFNLKRVPEDQIAAHLGRVLEQEGIGFEPTALRRLAFAAEGSIRDALSLLDQAIAFGGGAVQLDAVDKMLGHISRGHLHSLLHLVMQGEGEALMRRVEELAALAPDYDTVLADLITLLHDMALAQQVPDSLALRGADAHETAALAAQTSPEDIQLYYEIAVRGRRDLPLVPDPRHALEMVLLRMLLFRPAGSAESVPAKRPSESVAGGARADEPPERPAARPQGETPSVTAPATASAESGGRGGGLTEAWEEILDRCDMNRMVRLLASHCSLKRREPGLVVLQLSHRHDSMHSESRVQLLGQALSDYFGEPTRVRIEFEEDAPESPAERERRLNAERQLGAEAAIATDPVVEEFRNRMGASVVAGSVRPVD